MMDDEDEIMKILVATDSHLGFKDANPVRCMDSFAAFEEVLLLAREEDVDMMLLGGDLFHDNKPSRPTLHRAMSLLRNHVFGERPVEFQVISDQAKNFKSADGANYANPFVSVSLPIFSIHGNHDDPMRDGGVEALAPLDLLAASNMVNYFGAAQKVDDVCVSPVLLRKGRVNVALYGLGHIREERLNRVWQSGKLKFMRPREDDEDGNKRYHYVLVLHQNREIGRGLKSHIHEDMIPKWFDLVIWGHEHESRSTLENSVAGTFRITQPGSSVATSFSDGEAKQKHVCLLSVRLGNKGHQFMLKYIPLTMVRPFVVDTVALADLVDERDENEEADVGKLLAARVESLIETAVGQAPPPRFPDQTFKINEPTQPLVRLKVDTSGFQAINAQKFGGQFVGKVANPSEILHYSRSLKKKRTNNKTNSSEPATEEDALDTVRVEDLVRTILDTSEQQFELFEETKLNDALVEYVDKAETGALNDAVDKSLAHMQRVLNQKSKNDRDDDDDEEERDLRAQVAEQTRRKNDRARARRKKQDDSDEASLPSSPKSSKERSSKRRRDVSDDEDDEENSPPPSRRRPKKRSAATPVDESEESEDEPPKRAAAKRRGRRQDDSDDEPPAKRRAPAAAAASKTAAPRKGRRQAAVVVVDSDEEEEEEPVSPPRASRRAGRERKKVSYVVDDDDDEEIEEDEDFD